MSSSTAVPKGSTIIVTGANGYLGMHVADQLLASGYKVKGTVRDADKVQWTTEYFNEKYGKGSYEAVIVDDFAKEGAFDHVIKGSTGVIHVASDVTFGPDPNEVIPGVIDGITSLLNSAALEPSIKSFVLTSSSAAIDQGRLGQKYLVDGNLWNHEAVKAAWAPPPYTAERAIMVYFASKTQAEQKAWELVKSGECSDLRFNAVNPNFMMGRFLHPKQNKSSGGMVMGVRNNDSRAVDTFKSFGWQWMVDVVDVAKLHVIALVDPAVRNERILAYTEKTNFNILVDRIGKVLGPDAIRYLEKIEEGEKDLREVDVKRSEELLRGVGLSGFKGFDQTLKELFESAA